jgi:hypothetical protein
MKSRVIDISSRGMNILCQLYNISPHFIEGVLDEEYMFPLGYGYFSTEDVNKNPQKLGMELTFGTRNVLAD